jgi:hypothetical protein
LLLSSENLHSKAFQLVKAIFQEGLALEEADKESDLVISCFFIIPALNIFGLLCSPMLYALPILQYDGSHWILTG